MEMPERVVVTGAFGYTGKYITRRLLAMGKQVLTLTGHPERPNPFGDLVNAAPFHFDDCNKLARSLQGATTFYNTYWVRFPYGQVRFETAVANTKTLLRACQEAGVRKFVHISITNASEHSRLPYFKGKGLVEKTIIASGLQYAIVRPTVIFGPEDILINNIAWLLRRLPFFAVPGSGDYRIQPVFIEDVAEIAINASRQSENFIVDAVGPETYTFDQMVREIGRTVGGRARIIHLPPRLALFLSRIVGWLMGDIVLTEEEVDGLMSNLLTSGDPPTGRTRFSAWLTQNAARVGASYASELRRHYRR